ncbi:hypothetical protein [Rhizomicrobium electricum]|uniref:Uncharacterized protein n=1 Tax=Rhizomicrobium electricum TaxID=480070 RepID=A0ABP3Q2G0_9PROT|nr:hypothetical protein [Rhizomicrobium electricum]NIJ49297.1 hypothetical protein [Rhizomicrobium electricum]
MADKLHIEIAQVARQGSCSKVEDLFEPPAKRILARLLPDFLAKYKLTATELLHRAEMLHRVESTGSLLQFVVQQVAVARASSEGRSVQEIIREFNKLIDGVIAKVHGAKRNGLFPELPADKFGALAGALAAKPDGLFILNGALAFHLRDAKTWNEKALRLIAILKAGEKEGGAFLRGAIDVVLGELVATPKALDDLIGSRETFGDFVLALLHHFLGMTEEVQYADGDAMPLISTLMVRGVLPLAHAALAERIVDEIYSLERLREDSLDDEMRMFRDITALVLKGTGNVLKRDDALAALDLRSKRFVTAEAVKMGLSNSVLPDEKIDWLLFAESCITGARSKQILAEQAVRIATADSFKTRFQISSVSLSRRLQRLAGLCAAAEASGFHENDKRQLASACDSVAYDLTVQTKLFETIEARSPNPVEKVLTLLKLSEAGTFTEGRLSQKVRDLVIGYMATPGFLAAYIKYAKADPAGAMSELTQRTAKIGLSAGDVRELLAA